VAAGAGALVAPANPILAAGIYAACFLRTGRRRGTRAGAADVPVLAQRLGLAMVVLSFLAHIGLRSELAGAALALSISVAARLVEAWRRQRRLGRTGGGERTVLVGNADEVARWAQLLTRHPEHGARPVATATPDGLYPTVLPGGSIPELPQVLAETGATHLLVVSPGVADAARKVFDHSRPAGVRLSVVPPMADLLTTGAELIDVRGLPIVSLSGRRAPEGPAWLAKRALDHVVAGLAVLMLAPLLVVVALMIRLDSGGPVFFRQKRVGRNGKIFSIWKFRSMVVDAEDRLEELATRNEANGPYFKMADDPRVTRIGRWLRKLSLDELPQLFNVLLGHMSLVGPRPFLATELAAQPDLFTWRLDFLPGMTGLWQVTGRSWLPVEEGLRMDLAYVEHWSLLLDVSIIARTIGVVLGGTRRPAPSNLDDQVALDRTRYLPLVVDEDLRPTMRACDLSIIVVTHESAADIDQCLMALLDAPDGVTTEVIVVDNASRDGTAAAVASRFPTVRVIRKKERHGFATNCNIGAVAAAGRHLMLLNPDTRVHEGAASSLVSYLDNHPEVGAVGPRLVYPDGSPQASARRFPTAAAALVRRTPLRLLFRDSEVERHHLMFDQMMTQPQAVDWVLGAALAVRGETFAALGGLDDGYRLYCEDIDLCWRVQAEGWWVHHLPAAVVEHELSELTRRRFLTRATVWHIRSMLRFLRKHGFRSPRPTTMRGRASTPRLGPTPALGVAVTGTGA